MTGVGVRAGNAIQRCAQPFFRLGSRCDATGQLTQVVRR